MRCSPLAFRHRSGAGAARLLVLVVVLVPLLAVAAARAQQPAPSFPDWLAQLRSEALQRGLAPATVSQALNGIRFDPAIIELDQRQPEFTRTFWEYLDNAVSEQRVDQGRRMLAEHAALLARVENAYHVQPRFLVAFWGLESNYGAFMGDYPVVQVLATLAYDGHRRDFFRAELFDALRILDAGYAAPWQLRGSWAGAMGNTQFMPSTYLRYAVDFEGNGKRDLWTSLPDVFASSANYLSSVGWHGDETWGREVRLPSGFPWELADPAVEKPLAEWRRLGVRKADGGELPAADMTAALLLPMGHSGPAFLVYRNFKVILHWNNSTLYALAVAHLADRLAGQGPLTGPRPALGPALSHDEVSELQTLLIARGFDPGTPDGRVGPATRAALRAWQLRAGLPADAYPTQALLARLRRPDGQQ